MRIKQSLLTLSLAACFLVFFSVSAHADRPLKSALDLNFEQTAQVNAIQKEARDAFRKPRGELHRKERELRRAKIASDAALMARLEQEIRPLQDRLRQIHAQEERKIRAILTVAQTEKYEVWLRQRDAMVGSSRDVKEYLK